MTKNAYYNGAFGNISEIKLSLTDRAVFFGDGIYDAAIGRCGKIFMAKEHIRRFFSNARRIGITPTFGESELYGIFSKLISSVSDRCFFLYFQLSRYSDERCHSYPESGKSNLLVTIKEIPEPTGMDILRLTVCEDIRHGMCDVKTLNLLPSVLAAKQATLRNADEAVFKKGDIITECSHSNVHIIKDGRLITHPLDSSILPGISRYHLLSVCRRTGVLTEERRFSEKELLTADEVLVTSTSRLAARAESTDGHPYGISDSTLGARLCMRMYEDFIGHTAK
ncbi:MAG: D-amino acid aminotransferase [Ruminococcaceae bacterium]|nr:D-amino acid aminotransferase [Oscillospiraceae bacterium]